jgi:hypothetical protein
MTWKEAALTLQLMAEERIGTYLRQSARAADEEQDNAAATLRKAFAN